MSDTSLAEELLPETAPREMRILVIDDNELDRQRVLRLCQRAGLRFQAVEAATIAETRAALDAQSFDLILVDYLLAGETGLEAVDLIAWHPGQAHAAAVMMAGEGHIQVAVEAMRRGCADYLTKSMMNVDTLQKSIAAALERRMLLAALNDERNARAEMEASVRAYAEACTADMRTILASTLRRVRELRSFAKGKADAFVPALTGLEGDIDRLWHALPQFRDGLPLAGPDHPAPALRPN